jgi:hypothetical protein
MAEPLRLLFMCPYNFNIAIYLFCLFCLFLAASALRLL